GKCAAELSRRKHGEAASVRDIIHRIGRSQLLVERDQIAAAQQRYFARLIVIEPLHIDGEAGLNRAVQKIRFGKAERDVANTVADLAVDAQSLAEAQEVVCRITEGHKAARNAADAARQL